MNTPIINFVREYAQKDPVRFHMPGHKGSSYLGIEKYDITEVAGADELYAPDGIIAQSEENARQLFGTGRTLYSTEGSSLCIRAMLYLALKSAKNTDGRPYVIATRNVHKTFIYTAAMLDIDVVWLYPEEMHSICSCHVNAELLENELKMRSQAPIAVYITSPDYLGTMLDVAAFAEVCHRYHTILAVDNAHGAYLHFMQTPLHPMDLGADICCDSAHKTLSVLTGGAYLHIHKKAPRQMIEGAKQAMALFGSTSPSYIILQSLDLCNKFLERDYRDDLEYILENIQITHQELKKNGWEVLNSEPLKITIVAPSGKNGYDLAEKLRQNQIECEYADESYVVCMISPENSRDNLQELIKALGENLLPYDERTNLSPLKIKMGCSIRQAIFGESEMIPVMDSIGRICGAPLVSCPPAIPIVVSGEIITKDAVELLVYYGIKEIEVCK